MSHRLRCGPGVVSRLAAGSLAVALAAGLTGCRQRLADQPPAGGAATSQSLPDGAAPPTAASSGGAQPPAAAASGAGAVSQQDLDTLQGIIASVGGAVTSARSAIAGDAATPQG